VPAATRTRIHPAVGVVAFRVTRHPVHRRRSIHPTRTSQKQWRRLSRTAIFWVKVRVRRARASIKARLAAVNGRGSTRTKMKYMVRFWRW
jgi:hypothetical protein